MIHRFKKGVVYSGELIFGGCGGLERNKITILKRTKGWLVYQEQYGKVVRQKRQYTTGWGDCFYTPYDEFHAYSVEPF